MTQSNLYRFIKIKKCFLKSFAFRDSTSEDRFTKAEFSILGDRFLGTELLEARFSERRTSGRNDFKTGLLKSDF